MALQRALSFTRKAAQWLLLFGLVLAAFGLVGWLLAIFHHPLPFLLNLGILALPVIFVGFVFLFIVAGIEQVLIRRQSPRA
jgi:uncharacterized membrane protein